MKILALDVGEKRIGVAKADSNTRIAVPVGFIEVDGSEWQEISKIARLNNTNLFVLGLPRSNEGNETAQSLYVRQFAKTLVEKVPGVKIRFQDESLTSVLAEERLKSRKKHYEKGEIDAEAASIILQDFLESLKVGDSRNFSSNNKDEDSLEKNINSSDSKSPKENLERLKNVSNLAKKEANKVKLKTKKAKHKMKTVTKWISIVVILAIIGLASTGISFLVMREQQRQDYAAWVAEQEAKLAETFTFTIKPGETISEVKDALIDAGYSVEDVDVALNSNYDFWFLKERPEGASLEGYLYGETYEFYEDAPVAEIIKTFLGGMEKVIEGNNLKAMYAKQGLTLHEGITLASVIQKEAPAAEMPTVAQVFLSRLSYGMLLGSDVTVSYAIDLVDPDRQIYTDNTYALTIDSCYNTRLYAGLPCGPISNPGIKALLAVAEPADTSYLYFLTGDDDMMYYGYTEAEHVQNIYDHCQDRCGIAL